MTSIPVTRGLSIEEVPGSILIFLDPCPVVFLFLFGFFLTVALQEFNLGGGVTRTKSSTVPATLAMISDRCFLFFTWNDSRVESL